MSDSTRLLTDFDPLDQDMRFDDFRRYEQIRQAGGIAWSPAHGGFWAVADFELVRAIALDHTRFLSGPGVRVPPNGTPPTFALEYDRPAHTAHRGILTEAVGPRTAPTLDGPVRQHARRLLDGATDGRLDLGDRYAFQLSVDVMFELIGAPGDLKEEVVLLAESLFLYRRPMPDGSDPALRLRQILDDLVATRAAEPTGDWLSRIVSFRNHPEAPLTDEEVRGAVVALLVGGHHSTARATGCLLAQIVADPDLQRRLRQHPERLPAAVEETVRLWTPLRWFARTAVVDVELGSALVAAGERVLLLYAGANRDPNRFDDPDSFFLDRPKGNGHLAFGWGIHRCVGLPLAQLEMRVAVEELFARTSWVDLESDVTWTSSVEPRHIPSRLHWVEDA